MSATPADKTAMKMFRPSRTVLSSLVALLITVVGVLVAAEVVSALLNRPLVAYARMYVWAVTNPWRQPLILIVALLMLAAGLALLVTALRSGRSGLIPVHTGDPDLMVGVRARSFASALGHTAEQVPGVYEAHASIRGPTVTITGRVAGPEKEQAAEAVRHAVLTRMAALQPVTPLAVRVDLKERA
ncbi:DUF6286 domain-containing protein [Nonomuraea sediminis]|uniref:DUF6286 domain-containing protein n=1 Tax=Nonomuraea sediminis TaxID=2835864 RepID=UPI001BDBD467|nr:DUF6286 domain-containing protein [Nonomuraea sediminis]